MLRNLSDTVALEALDEKAVVSQLRSMREGGKSRFAIRLNPFVVTERTC